MHHQHFENKEDRGRKGCFGRHQHAGPQGWFGVGFFGGHGPERGPEGGPEGRGRHGFGGPWRGRWERGFGGGRLFDAGDLKLVILKLLSEQPSYGYQLMKTMEERLAGGYTPSAGVIYPTLTMLEEEGLASVSDSADNKKVYTVTAAGLEYLEQHKQRIEELFARLDEARGGFERGRAPEIMKAFMNLRSAVMTRVSREATAEQIRKITEAINAAAKTIDEM
ncbi:MAG TPA: PadR family transcriptional regulator [Acidobacteriaceae bacterium]|jgi:DNA-binding PadR family transcriptional regulator